MDSETNEPEKKRRRGRPAGVKDSYKRGYKKRAINIPDGPAPKAPKIPYVKKSRNAKKYVPKSPAEAERLRKLSERQKIESKTPRPGAGRPKGVRDFKTVIKEQLAIEVKDKEGTVLTAQEAAVRAQVFRAIKGDLNAVRWLADRADGTALQSIESTLQGPNGGPIEVKDVDAEITSILDAAISKAPAAADPPKE